MYKVLFLFFKEIATKMRFALVTCLLLLIVMEEPTVVAGRKFKQLKARVEKLEERIKKITQCSGRYINRIMFTGQGIPYNALMAWI